MAAIYPTGTCVATTTGTTHVVYSSNNADYTRGSTDTPIRLSTNSSSYSDNRVFVPAPEPEDNETVDVQIIVIFWVVETKRPPEPLRLGAWLKHPPRCRSPPILSYCHPIH